MIDTTSGKSVPVNEATKIVDSLMNEKPVQPAAEPQSQAAPSETTTQKQLLKPVTKLIG